MPDCGKRHPRGKTLAAQGAAIVDIGAESTLAHAARVDKTSQNEKLLPIVRALSQAEILVSVETYESEVASASLEAGAKVLNITGTQDIDDMLRAAAAHQAAVILCYVQGSNVREVGDFDFTRDSTEMLYEFFARQTERAGRMGVEKIILDPGLGFYYRNLQDSVTRVRHQMNVFLKYVPAANTWVSDLPRLAPCFRIFW